MTVVRLDSGDLFLHSPIRLTGQIREGLEHLGKLKFIVAPNRFHHLYVGDYLNSFTDAQLYCAPGLEEKRHDLTIDGVLDDTRSFGWENEIEHLVMGGIPLLSEVIFFHPSSNTLIVTDLLFNFSGELSLKTKLFAWIDGVYRKPSVPRLIRYFVIKDKDALRESIQKVLGWDFDCVVLSHGSILETGGHQKVKSAFEWL